MHNQSRSNTPWNKHNDTESVIKSYNSRYQIIAQKIKVKIIVQYYVNYRYLIMNYYMNDGKPNIQRDNGEDRLWYSTQGNINQ